MREKAHSKGLSAGYLEDRDQSDDEGGISLSEIKNKFKRGGNLSQGILLLLITSSYFKYTNF